MGALRIQIGALDRPLTAPDQKMINVMAEVVEATDGPVGGTNEQKADHVLLVIRRYLVETANGNRLRKDEASRPQRVTMLDLDGG